MTASLAMAAACGGGEDAAVGTTSPAVTSTSTTAPAEPATTTTSTPRDPTTTSAPPATTDDRFDPACVEREPAGPAVAPDHPALEDFAPLGAEPVVQLVLPTMAAASPAPWTRASASRIPGGMLVLIRPESWSGASTPNVLVAVDADGSIRWQRCLDPAPDVVRVAGVGNPTEMILGWSTYGPAGLVDATYELWSLADGRPSRTWGEALAASGITGPAASNHTQQWVGESSLLVLRPDGSRGIDASDALLVVDPATMAMRAIPYPPRTVGLLLDAVDLRVASDGRLIALEAVSGVPGGRATAVERDGGWSTSSADLDAALPVRGEFSYAASPPVLLGLDATGSQRWQREDVVAKPTEGFDVATQGGVVLASACSAGPSEDEWCPGPKLIAVDADTGSTLWQRDGHWAVSVIGDGRALVSGPRSDAIGATPPPPPVWTMIDLATGEQVGTTSWTEPWHFGIGCCEDPLGASLFGGVVLTYDAESVELWYPAEATTPLRRVDLG